MCSTIDSAKKQISRSLMEHLGASNAAEILIDILLRVAPTIIARTSSKCLEIILSTQQVSCNPHDANCVRWSD